MVEPSGALLALLGPERDGFRSNVIVSGGRLPEVTELGALAMGALASCEPDSIVGPVLDEPQSERQMAVAVRRGTTTAEDVKLVQLAAIIAAEDLSPGGLRSVFQLLGTCRADRVDPDEAILSGIISSFSSTQAESPAATAPGA